MSTPHQPEVTYEGELSVVLQGDTSTESRIGFQCFKVERGVRSAYTGDQTFRIHICNNGTYTDATNGILQVSSVTADEGSVIETHQATKDLTFAAPPAGIAEAGTLTITTLVHGETVTVGSRIYEVDGGTGILGTSNGGGIDISSYGTKSQGTITITDINSPGNTMTIGPRLYTFVADLTANADGEINIGATLAEAQANIVAAINGTDGVNTANPVITAGTFAANVSTCTAILAGVAGDALVFVEGIMTPAGNVLNGAGTLGSTTAGVAATATECGDAFVAALAADANSVATGSNAAGTVTVTQKTAGAFSTATTETSGGAAWGAAVMTNGATALGGIKVVEIDDSTGQTYTIRCSPGADNTGPFSCAPLQHTIA